MSDAAKSNTLDELLAEFETKPETAAKNSPSDAARIIRPLVPVIKFAQERMEKETKASVEKDIDDAISFLMGVDETKALPKRIVRGFLNDFYTNEREAQTAWQNKGTNPEGFTKVLEKARSALVEEVKGLPQAKLRTDVEAAKASVSGQRKPAEREEAPTVSAEEAQTLSDSKWRALMRKLEQGR